jgi:dTDP-4-amino-4,6-dideoxygalactose transaminase
MRITGEVITTPYSFVATTHSIWWNGLKPVFVDVDEETGNINPEKIEAAITPHTTAIMPVHVYGTPCNTERIQEIADIYGLKIIYDAAHAFGVRVNGESVLKAGDMSSISFHATKVYNTIEGGALICHDEATKKRIDYLKNFGFADETTVVAPGINSKMDEIRSAYGLLNLKQVDCAIEKRKAIANKYRAALKTSPESDSSPTSKEFATTTPTSQFSLAKNMALAATIFTHCCKSTTFTDAAISTRSSVRSAPTRVWIQQIRRTCLSPTSWQTRSFASPCLQRSMTKA